MDKSKGFFKQSIMGSLISVIFLFVGILIFALILKFTPVSEKAIYPVNQFIKIFAVFIGSLVSVKGDKGFIKGMLSGAMGMLLAYLILSLFSGFALLKGFIIDLVFSAVIGGIAGVIKVNAKAK
ncbi:MAG: TIGR04086 family membrane protein [Clostridia bacterium]|nr:TIGR04086 family membrane protein [Clostridia bacterium]